jgi:glycosyltransferase involved in cell wall biosynthesis
LSQEKITVGWLFLKYESNGVPMQRLIGGLDPERYRIICIFLKKTSDATNTFEEKGYKAFYISRKKSFRVFNLAAVWKLYKILRQEGVSILHCQRHQATVYGSIAAKLAKTPVVFAHVHGLNRSKKLRRKLINYFVLKWNNKIIAVSQAVKEDILRNNYAVRPKQVDCLNNSIDYKRFANVSITREQARKIIGMDNDSFIFGTVGRLVPTKGLPYLIQAFAKVKEKVPNTELVLIGKGRLKDELKSQAVEAGIGDSVHFLGYRADVEQILQGFDVFVMASVAEGMPGALLEAMAAGLPCIATKVGGIPDVLDNGKLGRLVKACDVNALAEAMVSLAKKPDLTSTIHEAQRKVQEYYSHDVIIKSLENIYETEYTIAKQNN